MNLGTYRVGLYIKDIYGIFIELKRAKSRGKACHVSHARNKRNSVISRSAAAYALHRRPTHRP